MVEVVLVAVAVAADTATGRLTALAVIILVVVEEASIMASTTT